MHAEGEIRDTTLLGTLRLQSPSVSPSGGRDEEFPEMSYLVSRLPRQKARRKATGGEEFPAMPYLVSRLPRPKARRKATGENGAYAYGKMCEQKIGAPGDNEGSCGGVAPT